MQPAASSSRRSAAPSVEPGPEHRGHRQRGLVEPDGGRIAGDHRREVLEPGELGRPGIHRETVTPGTFRRHVPRSLRGDPTREGRVRDGRHRDGGDVRRARRRGQPPGPPAAGGRRAARGSRRLLHGEPSPLPRGGVGLPLRRGGVHGVLVTADERRAHLHPERLRGQGLHHVEVQGRPGHRGAGRHARRRRCA